MKWAQSKLIQGTQRAHTNWLRVWTKLSKLFQGMNKAHTKLIQVMYRAQSKWVQSMKRTQ